MCSFIRIRIFLLFIFSAVAAAAQEEALSDTTEAPLVTVRTTGPRFLPVSKARRVPVREVPGSVVSRLKEEEAYWYVNEEPQKKTGPVQTDSLFDKEWFRTLLWIIIVVSFVAVVVWYLASSNIQLFRKESKKIGEAGEQGQDFAGDIFSLNYEREISRAVEAKNFRLAVRLWYLRTLKELADRNLIDYRHEKTNSEYLAQLAAGPYYRDFFRVTRNFEYSWYGQFPLSAEGYSLLQADFAEFKNGLPS